ncbi:MAG: hypothetical protein U1E05_09180 [Patescibacteria group bacterium]|nr:hypothetical protein [Patescibacteria group bacterium]
MKCHLLSWLLLSFFAVSYAAAEQTESVPKTPETSKHFRKFVEPQSGVGSYILDTRIAENQQSLYFTQKSMTEDGRFIVFWVSGGPRGNSRSVALVDLLKDEVVPLEIRGSIPYLDTETAILYWFEPEGFFRMSLRAEPREREKLCDIPRELKAEGKEVRSFATHVTLTADRGKVFMDARVDDRFIQGMLDIETGRFEKWGEEAVCVNHGQIHPTNDRLALCAHETRWTDSQNVEHRIKKINGVYPRLLLVEPEGKRRVIPPVNNYATHEYWAADGKGFYYCSHGQEYGVIYYDLASGQQRRVAPVRAAHATMSADHRNFTYDYSVGPWYRGCSWQVGFYNSVSGKEVFIYSVLPAFNTKENPSKLHPDPHPQFVCGDQYIICTINHGDGRMDLSVTPVAQLIAKTQ